MITLPTLSEFDPATSQEGSLDPLGLNPISEALGVALAPGVRERQHNPRYLTLMMAGSSLCKDFDPDKVALDEVSAPWQVYEWHVVEGLVRSSKAGLDPKNLPGVNKTQRVLKEGRHL